MAIETMGRLAPHLSAADLELAKEHYLERAPRELRLPPPAPLQSSTYVDVRLPAGAAPSASHVTWLPTARLPELFATDLRRHSLYRVSAQGALERASRYLNAPVQARFADLEGDGERELVVAGIGSPSPSSRKLGSIMVQRRWPTDRAPSLLLEGLGRPAGFDLGDLDQDGDLDVVVPAFGFRGPGALVLGEQVERGAFRPRSIDERDGFVRALATDLDGDGALDVVALIAQEFERVLWFRQTAPWTFERHVLHAAPHPGWGYSSLLLADLDGDGDEDLVLGNGDALDNPPVVKPYHGVAYLAREGSLRGVPRFRYRPIGRLPGCESVAVGDLDGDGDLDVAAGAFLPLIPPQEWRRRQLDSAVWFEQTDAGWRRHVLERARCVHAAIAVGDLDGDGRSEVAAGAFWWNSRVKDQPEFVRLIRGFAK